MAQIATITVETAGGPVDLPVYEPGDSGSGRLEAFRVQTASGPGFVPLAAVDEADRPYLRVQTSSGVRAVDTSASGIPDSAVHKWKIDEGSGGIAADSIGNNDFSITGATWTDEPNAVGGEILDFDGSGDGLEANYDSLLSGPNDFSIAFTLDMSDTNTNPTGSGMVVTNETGAGRNGDGLFISIGNQNAGDMEWSSTDGNFKHNASIDISGLSGLTRFCGTHDATNGWTIYVDSNSEPLGANNANQDSTNQGLYIGENGADSKRLDSRVDNPIVYDKVLSINEAQNDYIAQPFA